MGSGFSFSDEQVASIIKRDLITVYNEIEKKKDLNRYTSDGYEVFYDFSEEVYLKHKIQEVKEFISGSDNLKIYYYRDEK